MSQKYIISYSVKNKPSNNIPERTEYIMLATIGMLPIIWEEICVEIKNHPFYYNPCLLNSIEVEDTEWEMWNQILEEYH